MNELILHHDGKTISVRLRAEGEHHEQRIDDFACEVSQDERFLIQWYLEEYLLYPYGLFRQRAARSEAAMQAVGQRLFDAVFGNRDTFRLYERVADRLGGARLVVEGEDATGWSLPWELLRDGDRDVWLAQKAGAFVRSHPQAVNRPVRLPEELPTLNVLMVIARPEGPKDVPFQSVARPLLEVFRPHRDRIQLDILRPPTFSRLAEVLREKQRGDDKRNFYHVLHFDGHGAFAGAPQATPLFLGEGGSQGHLFFEAEGADKKSGEIPGKRLGELLATTGVPVVLLNACQSGMSVPDAAFGSVGQQLLAAGAQGVVAMSYSVYVHTAARFMAHLYELLVNGRALADAVCSARMQLWADPQRPTARGSVAVHDWPVPVLFEAKAVTLLRERHQKLSLQIDKTKLAPEQAQVAAGEVDLPEEPDFGFIGRDALVLELEQALRDETIVLLEAPAGEGKTTSAVGFARWLAETGGLEGPAFFFAFTTHLPLSQVCDRVGTAFNPLLRRQGIEWHLVADPAERRSIALKILKQVPCLLIWDNFEPVAGFPAGTPSDWTDEEQQELKQFLRDLRGGKTKVLITSRRNEPWLGSIYRRVEIGGLNGRESREFAGVVLRRAGTALPDLAFGKEAEDPYQALLDYLRGNPLALQVILPQVAAGDDPAALLEKLRSGEAVLPYEDASQGRERSLAAALGYGLDKLDPALRARLALLGMFQGFVDADVLAWMGDEDGMPEAVRGRDTEQWRADLDAAAGIGLLRTVGTVSHTIHPAVPWFFHAELKGRYGDVRDALDQAYANAYGALGHRYFKRFQTDTHQAMLGLGYEEGNFRQALRIGRRRGLWDAVEGVLYGLNILLTTLGRMTEWTRLIEEVRAEVSYPTGEPLGGREPLWLAVQGHLAQIAETRRDWDGAERIHLRLKDHYQREAGSHWETTALDDLAASQREGLRNLAVCLQKFGVIAQERRRFDEAEQWYRQSLAIWEKIGDEHGRASTLHELGRIAQQRRRYDEAEQRYRQSLAIREKIGDEHGRAGTLHQLGRIAEERRRYDEAEQRYRQSLAIEEKIGDEHDQAPTLHQLGIIAHRRRRLDEAEGWYRQSLAIGEKIGDEHRQAQTLHQLGMIAQDRRRFDEAEQWYRQSLAIRERIGDEHGRAGTLHQLGRIAEQRGRPDEAIGFHERAAEIFGRVNDPHNLAIAQRSLDRARAATRKDKGG